MFRVVPDQLKISEGWVRCGHCGEVFDATAHLGDEADLARASEGVEPPEATALSRFPDDAGREPAEPAPAAGTPEPDPGPLPLRREHVDAPAEETRPVELATQPADLPGAPAELRPRPLTPTPPEEISIYGPDSQSLEPSPLDSPFVFRPSDLAEDLGHELDSVQPPPPRHSRWMAEEPEEPEEPTSEELEDVTFVQQARRRAFWARPRVRILLVLASALLAVLLVLQLVWQDRDRLAFAQPGLRPLLERLCGLMQCRLGPPRQIDAVAIESSGFNRLRGDPFRLAFTLRNAAPVPVALPAMELTLTDGQEQAVARRVLLPSEFAASEEALPAGGDWSRAVGVAVDSSASARVAGYRLLAFYP
jgi:predicted Zn finger-like uncharacterized protein